VLQRPAQLRVGAGRLRQALLVEGQHPRGLDHGGGRGRRIAGKKAQLADVVARAADRDNAAGVLDLHNTVGEVKQLADGLALLGQCRAGGIALELGQLKEALDGAPLDTGHVLGKVPLFIGEAVVLLVVPDDDQLANVDEDEYRLPKNAHRIEHEEGAVDDLGDAGRHGEGAQPHHAPHQHRHDQQEIGEVPEQDDGIGEPLKKGLDAADHTVH
jgi:hypothetical protein